MSDDNPDNEVNRWCGILTVALGLFILGHGVGGFLGWTLVVPPKADSAFVAVVGSGIVLLGVWCFKRI